VSAGGVASYSIGATQILTPVGAVNFSSMRFPVLRTPVGSSTMTSASWSAAVLAIELGHDLGLPLIREPGKLFSDVDAFHPLPRRAVTEYYST